MKQILLIHPDNVKDIPLEYQHLERRVIPWASKNIKNEDGSEEPGFWVLDEDMLTIDPQFPKFEFNIPVTHPKE